MLQLNLYIIYLTSTVASIHLYKDFQKQTNSLFSDDQIIFTTNHNITKLLVPANGVSYVHNSDIPSIFFTVEDQELEGGYCIYVLEGFAAYEILEGGRDATSDYGDDKAIFFGANDGVYEYNAASLSAKKYGPFRDDIIQIQKANGTDAIYYLTTQHRIFKLESNGMVRTRISSVVCALQFVLDTSNNIYFISCDDSLPRVVTSDGKLLSYTSSITEVFDDIKLLRPAFIMDQCVPFFADGFLYIIYANGTSEKKDFHIKERPTAFSIDATLYLVASIDGKIYEFNVMEVLLKSMFGVPARWPADLTQIVMSVIGTREGNY